MTIVTAGQSLLDVALQECGSLEALFDIADAAGLTITGLPAPGAGLPVPDSAGAVPAVAAYFAGRARRVNTGAELPTSTAPIMRDYEPRDFTSLDFL